jgi:pilus assembly protein CpaF
MKLRERLERGQQQSPSAPPPPLGRNAPETAAYQEMKAEIHAQLIDDLDLSLLDNLAPDELSAELRRLIERLAEANRLPLNRIERERLVQEVLDEITGLGPLQPLLADPTISDILVNGHDTVYVERAGMLSKVEVRFKDDAHLMRIINRIVARVGRRVDETSPMVDARLPDGSRVNVIIPPLALDGPALSIRRFGARPLLAADLVHSGALTQNMLDFLTAAVRAKLNVLISGGTGTGKTTLLNALSSCIPPRERIVTIEDAAELQLQQPHVVRLETRPPNVEGHGEIRARELVINSLRMRPDRIIVGEVRGAEVLDMLQAMNTGHDGSMTTVHANTTRDALGRLLMMAGVSQAQFSEVLLNQSVARAINVIIQLNRFPDGSRRIVSISEITGMEGNVVSMQDIFVFKQTGVDARGGVLGQFAATGIRPRCLARIEATGYAYRAEFA